MRSGFFLVSCLGIFILGFGSSCNYSSLQPLPPDAGAKVPAAWVEVDPPVVNEDGGSGVSADNQPGNAAEVQVDRELDCCELVDSDVGDPGNCHLTPILGCQVRKFDGATRRGCSDVAVGNRLEATLRVDGCRRDDERTDQVGLPLFDVYYQCTKAIDITIHRNEKGQTYRLWGDAECEVQQDRIVCVNSGSPEPETVCGRPVDTFSIFVAFTQRLLDPENIFDLPSQTPDVGPFSLVSAAATDPELQLIFEGAVSQLGEDQSVVDYECDTGSARVTCEPTPDQSVLGEGGQTKSTTLTVEILESFPAGTMISFFSRFALDPGPVHLRATQTSASGLSPLGAGDPGVLDLLVLPNTAVLPHIPFGAAGPFLITTQIIVNNPHGEAVDGEFQFFNTMDGEPLAVSLEGVTSDRHPFTIGRLESRLFEIDPTNVDPAQIAWAFVVGDRELTTATNFSTLEAGQAAAIETQTAASSILAEAGIAASGVGLRHILNVSSDGLVLDTAFAIVNPTQENADIRLRLKRRNESGDPETVAEDSLFLSSHQQVALFFTQFFGLAAGPFLGTLEIDSATSITVMSLRTLGGLQSSSLPSGTP